MDCYLARLNRIESKIDELEASISSIGDLGDLSGVVESINELNTAVQSLEPMIKDTNERAKYDDYFRIYELYLGNTSNEGTVEYTLNIGDLIQSAEYSAVSLFVVSANDTDDVIENEDFYVEDGCIYLYVDDEDEIYDREDHYNFVLLLCAGNPTMHPNQDLPDVYIIGQFKDGAKCYQVSEHQIKHLDNWMFYLNPYKLKYPLSLRCDYKKVVLSIDDNDNVVLDMSEYLSGWDINEFVELNSSGTSIVIVTSSSYTWSDGVLTYRKSPNTPENSYHFCIGFIRDNDNSFEFYVVGECVDGSYAYILYPKQFAVNHRVGTSILSICPADILYPINESL